MHVLDNVNRLIFIRGVYHRQYYHINRQSTCVAVKGGGGGVGSINNTLLSFIYNIYFHNNLSGGRRSPAVACWASDHWVASSNPLRGKFRH